MICCIAPALATESSFPPTIKNQESTESIGSILEKRNILEDDPTRQSLFPSYHYKLRSWRDDIEKKLKMEVLLSYDMLFQGYAEGNTSMGASAGDFTFSGRRLFFGQKYLKPVYLSFRMRNRHAYGSFAPSQISSETGMLWKTVDGFTDAGFQIPDFYVTQELADKRLMLRYGQFSINDFFDKHKLRSAKRYFLNQAFSANPTIFFPSYGAGFVVQWKDSRNWDLSIGGSNMQGTDVSETINLTLDSSAIFYSVQGGYNFEGFAKRIARMQLLGWQNQNKSENGLPEGSGLSITLEHEGFSQGEDFLARYACSGDNAASVDELFMFGWGKEILRYDHLGLGFGIGRSADDRSTWQGVTEIYYRWQVTKELLITPDLQAIMGKGLKDNEAA